MRRGKELETMQTVQMPCFGKQRCYETNSKFCVSKSFKAINKPYIQIKKCQKQILAQRGQRSWQVCYVSAIDNKYLFLFVPQMSSHLC